MCPMTCHAKSCTFVDCKHKHQNHLPHQTLVQNGHTHRHPIHSMRYQSLEFILVKIQKTSNLHLIDYAREIWSKIKISILPNYINTTVTLQKLQWTQRNVTAKGKFEWHLCTLNLCFSLRFGQFLHDHLFLYVCCKTEIGGCCHITKMSYLILFEISRSTQSSTGTPL